MPGLNMQLFLLPPERRPDQKAGNEGSGQDFRSSRPSLAVNYTAHVADVRGLLVGGPLFSKASARADSQAAVSGSVRIATALAGGRAAGSYGRLH